MEHTSPENEGIKEEFSRRRRARSVCRVLLISVLLVLGLPLLVLIATEGNVVVGLIIAIVLIAAVIGIDVYRAVIWRCPACNAALGRDLNVVHCPSCGTELQ